MKVGKLSSAELRAQVLPYRGSSRPDVLLGPGVGLDSAVIDLGGDVCVISSDPITGAGQGAGRLAVTVATNDVAAHGAQPVGVQVVLLLPEQAAPGALAGIMQEIDAEARRLGVAVLGGHTEITSRVQDTVIVVTAVGRAPRDQWVSAAGARPGDAMVVTKGVGLEGTAILATDFRDELAAALGEELVARAAAFGRELSVVEDALTAAGAGARAMHDVTEGGLLGAVEEMCEAAGVGCELWTDRVPVRAETEVICAHLGLDPLGLLSSGSLLIAAPDGEAVVEALERKSIVAACIGRFTASDAGRRMRDRTGEWRQLAVYPRDELWRFLEGR